MAGQGKQSSLLAGRNAAPLTEQEVRRATNVFLGFDEKVAFRHEETGKTVFHVRVAENGDHYGEIVFGPDIYPGEGIVDPNSALSLEAAVAHELTHFHRWKDKLALSEGELEHLDEALTSLQATHRYERMLSQRDKWLLVADAIQRIHLFIKQIKGPEA